MSQDKSLTTGFDCQSCGMCCVVYADLVPVERDDKTPRHLTRSVRGVIGWASWEHEEGVSRMASRDGRCIALIGNPGVKCSCRVYDRRPSACKAFMPGSTDCLDARKLLVEGVT